MVLKANTIELSGAIPLGDRTSEPVEEFFIPEAILQLSDDNSEYEACCLCHEGKQLQQELIEHIHSQHLNEDDPDFRESSLAHKNLSCCFCPEGLRIQTVLINHLLSHFAIKHEVDAINMDLEAIVEPQEGMQLHEKVAEPSTNESKDKTKDRSRRRFTCNVCSKSFLRKQGLQNHFSTTHDPVSSSRVKYQRRSDDPSIPKIHCELCPKVFKFKQGLEKHWDLEHNQSNTFPCTKCTSRCKTLKNLHAHLRTHDPPRPEGIDKLQCDKCFKIFPTPKQLSLHRYTHREKFFCCDICGNRFNNREQIKIHVQRHVGLTKARPSLHRIICDECSMLVYSHKMKRHKLIHHSYEKPYKCDQCNAAFSDSRILSDHQNIHLKLKPYKCEYCDEAFRSGANLRLHRVRHTDPDRYRCNECQISFVTKQSLQKHNRRHTEDPDIRPFACDYPGCNSTFKQRDHIRGHFRRAHEKTDEIFSCEICDKSYNRKDALGKHMRKTHNISKRKPRALALN